MYCPRCGQQQASGSVRFCSRCGFRLELVPELINNDGLLTIDDSSPHEKGRSERKRRMRQGAKMMFISAVITPIFLGLAIVSDGPEPLLVPFTLFLAGLAWMLYFRLFGDDVAPALSQQQIRRINPPQPLVSFPPPQHSHSTDPAPRRVDTADMAQPPSVTDHTTKLFEEK